MANEQRILVYFAHPAQERSEVNLPMYRAAKEHAYVTAVDLYGEYPKGHINAEKEQARLRTHDVIIFLFPLYWYSTPGILKNWQDLVLEYGFAYGAEGKALAGKTFLCAVSAGGPELAYHADGFNHFSIRELLRPLEQMARFCRMQFIAPFMFFGARTALELQRVDQHVALWSTLLDTLVANELDLDAAMQPETLNELLVSISDATADSAK